MRETVQELCVNVLRKVTPSKSENDRVQRLAGNLKNRITSEAGKAGLTAEVRVEGSVAKNTWLKGAPEIDIFMCLPPTVPKETFKTVCLDVAKKATEGAVQVERFAEHPYLEAFFGDIRVNVVPCFKVEKGKWKSATDRTPFHTDYAKPLLNEKLRGEVRLLKKFLKGISVYGAEIKIGGFSGYLCELLTLNYRKFLRVLNAFEDWQGKMFVDIQKFYEGEEHEAELLFKEPLVVVDPVDKGRNVAAAVRSERLHELVAASRVFLKKPDPRFFYPPEPKPVAPAEIAEAMRRRGSHMIFVKFGGAGLVSDILWGQLYKSLKALRQILTRNNYRILRSFVWSNEADVNLLIFEVEHMRLPSVKKHMGPPLTKKLECERFLEKHRESPNTVSGPYIESGRWVVEVRRKHLDAKDLLSENLKDGGRRAGVAERISRVMPETLEILVNDEILEVYKSHADFAGFLTEYSVGKPFWLQQVQRRSKSVNKPAAQQ